MQVLGHILPTFGGLGTNYSAEGFRLEFSIHSIGFRVVFGLGFRLS